MNGLDIMQTPIKFELERVMNKGTVSKCNHYDLEITIGKKAFKPLAIQLVGHNSDFMKNYYPVIYIVFKCTLEQKEMMIAGSADLQAVLKTYSIPRKASFSPKALSNPVIKRYKAKLYLAESEYMSQDNLAANNKDYARNKAMVDVKLQLVERGLEELKQRYVGGNYHRINGADLIKHLVDYHSNLDNDDVATMLKGVDIAPGWNTETREVVVLKDGLSILQAMNVINHNTGGLYAHGFSYFIHNNVWYVFPPYSTRRFEENTDKLVIVNLPRDRVPDLEKTYLKSGKTLTILSTRDVTVVDKRESKKMSLGVGVAFANAASLVSSFAKSAENKLQTMSKNVMNEISVEEPKNTNNTQMTYSSTSITSAKNVELSKLAPAQGFVMDISWEGADPKLITPGMPVKVLYVKRGKMASAVGTVLGVDSVDNPYDQSFPVKKFLTMAYVRVFVNDEQS